MVFTEKLKYFFVETPKFKKTANELETLLDKWIFALKNLGTLTEKPASFTEEIFDRLFEAATLDPLGEEHCLEETLKEMDADREKGKFVEHPERTLTTLTPLVHAEYAKGKTPEEIVETLDADLFMVKWILGLGR